VVIKNIHFINPRNKIATVLQARIRHLGKLNPGKLKKERKNFIFNFNRPQESIAPGQIIVLYKKDNLIASGEIRLK